MTDQGSEADAVIAMMADRAAFINAQLGIVGNHADLIQGQADALVAHFNSLAGLTHPGATKIITAVQGGPWTESQKSLMNTALGNALQNRGHKTTSRTQQKCHHLENFFLQRQVNYLRDKSASIDAKVAAMSNWLWLLGITCPSEQILKRAIAILMLESGDEIQPAQAKKLMLKLRFSIKAKDQAKKRPVPFISVYPDTAAKLPNALLKFAFGEDMPITLEVPGLDFKTHNLGYRKTHTSLNAEQPKTLQLGSASSQDPNTCMQAMANAMQQMVYMQQGTPPPCMQPPPTRSHAWP